MSPRISCGANEACSFSVPFIGGMSHPPMKMAGYSIKSPNGIFGEFFQRAGFSVFHVGRNPRSTVTSTPAERRGEAPDNDDFPRCIAVSVAAIGAYVASNLGCFMCIMHFYPYIQVWCHDSPWRK